MSVLITLGDCPFIRYYDPNKTSSNINYKLAQILQHDLDELQKNDDSFPTKNEFKRTVLIITDRSFDMIAPFLHEFTYQALMNDLIVKPPADIDNGIRNATYFFPSPTYSILDETDSIWMLIRHWHFAEAVDYILTNFQKFLVENKAASAALGQSGTETGVDALKAMKETLSSLPQFQSLKQKYSIHISICQDAKMYFEKRNLDLVASVQQDLATGEASDGKTIKNSMMDLIPVLDNKKTSPLDKLRSLIIYIIAMNGVQDMERRRLLETAKINADDSQAISNLSLFDVILSSSQDKKSNKDKVMVLLICRNIHIGVVINKRGKRKRVKRIIPMIYHVMFHW
jgi:syntaxin-binding protein 1